MVGCTHKTDHDHHRLDGGVKVWKCSFCGKEGRWGESWAYHGAPECKGCGRAVVNRVTCGCEPPGRTID